MPTLHDAACASALLKRLISCLAPAHGASPLTLRSWYCGMKLRNMRKPTRHPRPMALFKT